jgi:hypothetical protein
MNYFQALSLLSLMVEEADYRRPFPAPAVISGKAAAVAAAGAVGGAAEVAAAAVAAGAVAAAVVAAVSLKGFPDSPARPEPPRL